MNITAALTVLCEAVDRHRTLERVLECEEPDLWDDGYHRAVHDIATAMGSRAPVEHLLATAREFDALTVEIAEQWLSMGLDLPDRACAIVLDTLHATTPLTGAQRETARVLLADGWTATLDVLVTAVRVL